MAKQELESVSIDERIPTTKESQSKRRSSLILPENLWDAARKLAKSENKTLTELIKNSLDLRLKLEEIAEDVPGVPGAKQINLSIKGKDYKILIL